MSHWRGAGVVLLAAASALWPGPGRAAEVAAPAAVAAAPADTAQDDSGRDLDVPALAERLRSARYVLLGEIHDNAVQHRLRAALLRALLADGRPSWVVFEQLDREHNAAVRAAPRDAEALITAGQLDRRAWGWPVHRPLFDAALAAGATVLGGNLSRADASRVVRGGVAQVPADLQRWLATEASAAAPLPAWTPAQEAALRQQIDTGHCGALPPALLAPMVWAQRARDAALAATLVSAPAGARVVLIAGNGHVRRDTGVPHYLPVVPTEGIVSIGFLERGADGARVSDGPYDEVWYTAPAERPDPCAAWHPPSAAP